MYYYEKTINANKLFTEYQLIYSELEKLPLPKSFFQFVLYCLSELFDNVKEHSKAERVSLKLKITGKMILLDILDNGIGFRKSYLRKGIVPKDDKSAIEFALSGLSTKDTKERGFGLYSIRQAIESLGGEMIIKSGKAKTIISKNKIEFSQEKKILKGVEVIIKSEIKEIDFYKLIR